MLRGRRDRSGSLRLRDWGQFGLAVVLALCAGSRPATAQVVYDNFGPEDAYQTGIGWTIAGPLSVNYQQGSQFTPTGSGQLSTIEIAMNLFEGPNHFDMFLHADTGGSPGALLESWSVDDAMGPFGDWNPPVVLSSVVHPMLASGTPYWLIGANIGTSWAAWMWNSTGDIKPFVSGPTGGPYGVQIGDNLDVAGAMRITVQAAAVPEPSSMALLLGGAGGCLAMIRRRKKSA